MIESTNTMKAEEIKELLGEISKWPWELLKNSWAVSTIYVNDKQGIVCENILEEEYTTEDNQEEMEAQQEINLGFIAQAPEIINQLLEELEKYNVKFKEQDEGLDSMTGMLERSFQRETDLKEELNLHRWIPVSKRLPETGQMVDVFSAGLRLTDVQYEGGEFYAYGFPDEHGVTGHDLIVESVTHWQPIIHPPTQREE